jgi:hypothetical protein
VKIILLVCLLLSSTLCVKAQSDPHELIQLAVANAKAVKSAAFKIENTERFDGELRTGLQEVRYQQQPFQVWMTFIYPDPGATIMYDATVNTEKMIYDPVGFPYMKLELDPLGAVARNNNQHTIYEIGFGHIGRLIEVLYQNSEHVTWSSGAGEENVKQISILSKRRGLGHYIVGHGETTRSVAQKLKISEYKLVELNEAVKAYGSLKEGLAIVVPDYYALETILDIDMTSYLPVKVALSDELGLLAAYSLSDVILDVEVMQPSLKKKTKLYSGE